MFNKKIINMLIDKKNIDKIKNEPSVFAEILGLMNTGNQKVMPDTLLRRLQRYSVNVTTSVVIVDYYRKKGLTEKQIFE